MTSEILDTRTEAQRACFVPVSKLVVHADNVRRTNKRADIEALAASIHAHGLLQNLSVVRAEDGRYAVVAGARRSAALRLLIKQGRLARDFAAPCAIVEPSLSAEASLAENIQRVAMNPMDEMEAFAALVDNGMSVEDVAARFGSSARHVEQRLALGQLSPKLRAAYRKAEITLDVARAFCLTADHDAQERLFKQFAKPITHAPSVRNALAGGRMPVTDKLARFVGLEAYEAAGGRVMRDLFEDNVAFLEDGDILQRLAVERMEGLRQDLAAEGWAWAEVQLNHGQIEGCASERLRPTQRPLSQADSEAAAALEAEIEVLDQQLESADDDDALWRVRDAAEARLDALRQSAQCFDAALMAHAGAVIAIDHTGAPNITRGLIKRADLKAVRKLQQAAEAVENEVTGETDADHDIAPDHPRLPKTLVADLTKARTRGLRAALATAPHVALALTVHVLEQASAGAHGVAGVAITSRPFGYDDEDGYAQGRVDPSRDNQGEDDGLYGLLARSPAELLARLALLIAETLDFSHQGASFQDAKLQEMSDTLASALDLDMRCYWQTSEDFWQRAPKAFILDALAGAAPIADLSEASRKVRLAALAKLTKTELAQMAAKALPGWLPDVLITPARPGSLTVTPDGEAALTQAHAAA